MKKVSSRKKPGNIELTTFRTGPSKLENLDALTVDEKEEHARQLTMVAQSFIRQHLGLEERPKQVPAVLTFLGMSATRVSAVMAAAGIAPVGWELPPEKWHPLNEDPRCQVTTEGAIIDYNGRCYGRYQFDADGGLVRETKKCVSVRRAGKQRCLTPLEALAAMAALLRAFAPLRLSLARDAIDKAIKHNIEVLDNARALQQSLRHIYARSFRRAGSFVLEAVLDSHIMQGEQVVAVLKDHSKKEARILLMGPLQTCFTLLFGKQATVDASRTNTPFIRFADAFFKEVGCPCTPGTVGAALDSWRRKHGTSGV